MLDVKVMGLAELELALNQLPDKLAKNVARAALRAGAKPILEEARRLVPVRSGKLRDTLRITTSMKGGTPRAFIKAGPGGTKKFKKIYYAHMIERGTAKHLIVAARGKMLPIAGGRKSVNHPGARKQPFMRPAADSQAAAAIDAFAAKLRERLTKAGIDIPDPASDDDSRD